MTGTGKAMTSTPLREHMDPNTFPTIVFGTMSPYLQHRKTDKQVSARGGKNKEDNNPFLKESARRLVFIMLSCCVLNVIFTSLEIVTVTLDYFTTSNKKSHI